MRVLVQARSTEVRAVTCLTQWWSSPSVSPAQGIRASPKCYSFQIHKIHAHTCWKLTCAFTHLLLTLSVMPHLFLPFSLDFPFHVSVFSEASCRVTDTASKAPHFRCTFAAPHRRGCCLCLATCHLIHRTRCLSSKVICLGSLSSKVLFLTPKSCHQDEIILLPPSAVSESDKYLQKNMSGMRHTHYSAVLEK